MLVLARKEADKIHFPSLGITLELLRIQGRKVRIGITAPPDVPIARHEVSALKSLEFAADENLQGKLVRLVHALRLRLDRSAVALNELHRRIEETADDDVRALVLDVFRELQALEGEAGDMVESQADMKPRALLVEDDDNQRQLLQSFLELSGVEVISAADGRDALDYLSLHDQPDVVLLDLLLPRLGGSEFVQEVRSDRQFRGLNLFAVSGTDPQSLGIKIGPQGVDRWFRKPVDPGRLVEEIAGKPEPPPTES